MKKVLLTSLICLNFTMFIGAQESNNASKFTSKSFVKTATQASPWVTETGLRYNMPILAQVLKDGVLFQPTGVILGVFKNEVCYGQSGLSNGPGGIKLHNVTIGCNNESEAGFEYKVFDPNTSTIYAVTETVDFKSLTPVGKINAPIQIHISGPTAIDKTTESRFNVYPNPIDSKFTVSIASLPSSTQCAVELFDLTGKLIRSIFKGELSNSKHISVDRGADIAKGIYVLKVTSGTKIQFKKLIFR
ncbi:MAG: T9SS type A sorting domain-containing protein [Bacteroidales bacterium]